MRKVGIAILCVLGCYVISLIYLPSVVQSYPKVNSTVCFECHQASSLMSKHSAFECTVCHSGTPDVGNVNSSSCIVCHPRDGNKGECELVLFHENNPLYQPKGNSCFKCHGACGNETTTTTITEICPIEEIYGENSVEVDVLRYVRDNILSKSPEGQEIIKLYYGWSPVIIKAMEEDGAFREEVKGIIDGVLLLIRAEVK